MCAAGSTLWVCTSTLYSSLTTMNYLLMGFLESLPGTGLCHRTQLLMKHQTGLVSFSFHFCVCMMYACVYVYMLHVCGCTYM